MKLLWWPGKAAADEIVFPGTDSTGTVTFGTPLLNYSGFSGAPVSHQTVRGPGQHGQTRLETLYDPRKVSFEVILTATTLQALLDAQRELVAAFDVGLGTGSLYWEQEDTTQYRLDCISDGECPKSMTGSSERTGLSQRLLFSLIAHDPFWYSGTPSIAYFTFTNKSFFPFNFPFNFQGSQTEIMLLGNSGSRATPVILKFDGPMKNPMIANSLTGESIALDLEIGTGEYVTINTDENILTATYTNLAGTTVSAFPYLSDDTVLRDFYLDPGANPCQLTCPLYGTGAGCTVTWSAKYAGV